MLESIYVGMTGLLEYSRGLRVIANNAANLNTPGYKSSTLQFTDMFYGKDSPTSGQSMQVGYGVSSAGTQLDFKQGELRQTGNNLDLALDGDGMFTLKDSSGALHFTRAGQFEFNADGVLVNRADSSKVLGFDAAGKETEISIAGLRTNPGKVTSAVRFTGNLSSTATEAISTTIKVFDGVGGEHALAAKFTNDSATTPGSWRVEVLDGTTVVGTGTLVFVDGRPQAGATTVAVTYKPAGLADVPLTLDFGADVTSFAASNLSTLAMSSQDGVAPGSLTGVNFDARGALTATYSNGQTTIGARLMLARFDTLDAVEARGSNQFDSKNDLAWHMGVAGEGAFASVKSGMVEISNVDLSREFSDLVIMQRGYQASSQIVSTANEMLQELFTMKSK